MTLVTNLAEPTKTRDYSLDARQAVIAAYAQSLGDYKTWEYKQYDSLVTEGVHTFCCGDWCAMKLILSCEVSVYDTDKNRFRGVVLFSTNSEEEMKKNIAYYTDYYLDLYPQVKHTLKKVCNHCGGEGRTFTKTELKRPSWRRTGKPCKACNEVGSFPYTLTD